jgi:hypothetical protein
MRDDFLEALQRERAEIGDQLENVVGQLEPLVRQRRELQEQARALDTVMARYGRHDGSDGARSEEGPISRKGSFLDVAWEILQAWGSLHYEALLARVTERGVEVPGRNPAANLVAHMSRDKRFKRVGRGTYAPV